MHTTQIQILTQQDVIDMINRHADNEDLQRAIRQIAEAKATFIRLSEGYMSASMSDVADILQNAEEQIEVIALPL